MLGDSIDMVRRMRALLPTGWFSDRSPVLDAVMAGLGTAFAGVYTLIEECIANSRIATAEGSFLDLIATDFFADALSRRCGESDDSLRERMLLEMLRSRATRKSVECALTQLTGNAPRVFEPALSSDTGGYTLGGAGFGRAGGWGSLLLHHQFFITVHRPRGGGIADLAGYGTGGVPTYACRAMEGAHLSDAEVLATIPALLPVGTTAWARICE